MFFAQLLLFFLVDRLGRKPLMLGGLITMFFSGTALGLVEYYLLEEGSTVNGLSTIAVICCLVFIGGFAVGVGSTYWILVSENFSTEVRAQGNSLVNVEQWLVNLILVFGFPSMIQSIGIYSCFWIFSSVALIFSVIIAIFLKETKGQAMNNDSI